MKQVLKSWRESGRALAVFVVCLLGLAGTTARGAEQKADPPASDMYRFDGTISRRVLENYLERSVTMAYFLVTGRPEGNREYLYRDDDIRLIRNIGAKFIGRAIYRWNGEGLLNDPNFWTNARALMEKVHAFDPDVIFQGCLFETISREVDGVKIPAWVFTDFGLPVEDRTFSYDAMLNQDGKLVNHWGRSSVPDVTRPETQLWFFYLAGSYIDLGCEALHVGQVALIGMADPDLKEWSRLLAQDPRLCEDARPPAHGADRRARADVGHDRGRREPPGFQLVPDADQGGAREAL